MGHKNGSILNKMVIDIKGYVKCLSQNHIFQTVVSCT